MQNGEFTFSDKLDTEFLNSIYDGDIEHAQVVFEQFLTMAPAQIQEIETSYKNGDLEMFRQKTHKLKPVFSFVGLTKMTEEAERLEKSCKEVSDVFALKEKYELFMLNYKASFKIIEVEISNMNKFIQVL